METPEQRKKMQKRTIFICGGMTILIMDLVTLAAYLTLKLNEPHEYKVQESTVSLYNNLLSFFNEASEGVHPIPTELISVTYKDSYLNLVGINDTNEITIKYQIDKDNINDALKMFEKSLPSIEGIEIESAYTVQSKELNIENKEYKGIISTPISENRYVSYTCRLDDKNLCSYPHQLYNESGIYSDETKSNIKDNQYLYDLYHYIIYGQ